MLYRFLSGFFWILSPHRKCRQSYEIIYTWYEEKRDECEELKARVQAREDAILEDLLIIKDLHVERETLVVELSGADRRYEKLQDDYNEQSNRLLEANDAITQVNARNVELSDTIEKMAIEIAGQGSALERYRLGVVAVEDSHKSTRGRPRKTFVPPA